MMKYSSENTVVRGGERYYVGDQVNVTRENGSSGSGKVSHITTRGFYLDVGKDKDAYFNFNDVEGMSRKREVRSVSKVRVR